MRIPVPRVAAMLAGATALTAMLSCGDSLAPLSRPLPPEQLVAQAVSVSAVRLSWKPVNDPDLAGYEVQRRVNHTGEYVRLPNTIPPTQDLVVFIDTDVEPETFYGYRVAAFTRFGDRSRPSVTSAARTPSPPGIVVATRTTAPVPDATDPDGYRVRIEGPDTANAALGLSANHRFAPLRAGAYKVTLGGVISRCSVASDSIRTVPVSDTGLNTLTPVIFDVRCRNPKRGRIIAQVMATGDSLSPNPFHIQATGIASDGALPDSARLYLQTSNVPPAGGYAEFDNLRPGSYEIELKDLEGHCSTTDVLKKTITTAEASADTARFQVRCESMRPPDDGARPLVVRNTWAAESAAPGERIVLTIAMDGTTRPQLELATVQGELRFDNAVLRFERMEASPGSSFDAITAGQVSPGFVSYISASASGLGSSGVTQLARAEFTVIGALGQTVATRSKVTDVGDETGKAFADSTRVVEDTLTIGISNGGTTKQSPVASHGGPYSGSVGVAVTFNAAGSNDPDGGAIASYRWDFGDGSAPSTVTTPTTTHTYSSPCTCNVSLTVTDDESATATAQTTASVINDTPVPGKPYVWRNTWSSSSAAVGQKVTLRSVLDLSAVPQQNVAAVTVTVNYNAAVLRFDRADTIQTNGFRILSSNGTVAGKVDITATEDAGLTGVVGIVKLEFTVLSASPSSVTTVTEFLHADDIVNTDAQPFTDLVRVVEATLQLGSGGGTPNQSPIASANGPYTGTSGVAVAFSSAGSVDPDGGALVSYQWNFGDGSAVSIQQNPSHTYVAANNYTVTLTVTDDENVSATTTTAANITAPGPSQPLIWQYAISTDSVVSIEVLYDIQADLPETQGVESVATWQVDSLKWNPAVLRLKQVRFGTGFSGGSVQDNEAASGKLRLNGSLNPAMSTGYLQLAVIQFWIVGSAGQSTTTHTWLGPITSPTNFTYNSRTRITEATFSIP